MKRELTRCALLALALAGSSAFAKLPAPTPEAQAKAAEAAARTAWNTKRDAYQLCKAQDRVAAKYRASAEAAGKPLPTAMTTPPCVDPGPYVAPAPAGDTKPIEASGAHSPSTTATAPPSSNQTSAETNPAPKK